VVDLRTWFFGLGVTLAGCDPCACVNTCTRNYLVDDPQNRPSAVGPVQIGNHSESGKDCELDQLPKSLPEGLHALRVTVDSSFALSGDRHGYRVTLESLGAAEDAMELCTGGEPSFPNVAQLSAADVAVGTTLCVVGDVRTSTQCTQLGCGS
jgi:hypothetical protein